MFLPYKVDVPMARWPLANWLIIAVTIATSITYFGEIEDYVDTISLTSLLHMAPPPPEGSLNYFLLQPGHVHPAQLISNLFIHAGWLHLIGNILFLWVFGNAVNAKVGQWQFILLYVGIGFIESLIWLAIGPAMPTLGASGAIMGIVGAFLLLYPVNNISSLFMFFYMIRPVEFSAGWLIGLYAVYDIYGAVFQSHAGIAYLSHVAGFAVGAGVIGALLWWKILEPVRGERTLFQVLGWMPDNPEDIAPIREDYLPATARAAAPAGSAPSAPPKPRDEGPIPLD